MTIKYLIVSWHQIIQEINGVSGVGTEEVLFFFFFFFFFLFYFFFHISHYSFLAAKINSDSGVSHIRLRDTTNPVSYFILSRSDN